MARSTSVFVNLVHDLSTCAATHLQIAMQMHNCRRAGTSSWLLRFCQCALLSDERLILPDLGGGGGCSQEACRTGACHA